MEITGIKFIKEHQIFLSDFKASDLLSRLKNSEGEPFRLMTVKSRILIFFCHLCSNLIKRSLNTVLIAVLRVLINLNILRFPFKPEALEQSTDTNEIQWRRHTCLKLVDGLSVRCGQLFTTECNLKILEFIERELLYVIGIANDKICLILPGIERH